MGSAEYKLKTGSGLWGIIWDKKIPLYENAEAYTHTLRYDLQKFPWYWVSKKFSDFAVLRRAMDSAILGSQSASIAAIRIFVSRLEYIPKFHIDNC